MKKKKVSYIKKEKIQYKNSSRKSSKNSSKSYLKKNMHKQKSNLKKDIGIKKNSIDGYNYVSKKIPIEIKIFKPENEYVPIYEVSISSISKTTEVILEKIRQELITKVNLGIVDLTEKTEDVVEDKFIETIRFLIEKYFPNIQSETFEFLESYLIRKSLGLGKLEILMDDENLEEIVVNNSTEPVWVYHKKYSWLKTNITIETEDEIKHYAARIGRKVSRQISNIEPLLDAHLNQGDRVNATLSPISTDGNTLTFRKFSRNPLTITNFLKYKTISPSAASLIWQSIHYELSAMIAGGTASGKTSALNVFASFFPPNQRIISIEDTREIRLPKFLHWVPMSTRQANVEGKGEVSMEDLLVNALRQRPDRILVGEVRRQKEAETLFEAIHTGHSCYATFHANNYNETIRRLTNPPINVPETMLPAISLIIMQFRNRRNGLRRTFQIAETCEDSSGNLLMQYDAKKDILLKKNKSKSLFNTLELYTGSTQSELTRELNEKEKVLKYLVKQDINTVDDVGRIMAEYYTNKQNLFKFINSNKKYDLLIKNKKDNNIVSEKKNIEKPENILQKNGTEISSEKGLFESMDIGKEKSIK